MKKKMAVLAGALLWVVATASAQTNLDAYANTPPAELIQKKELSAKDLESMVRYYRVKLKDEQKAAELESLLLQQNPKGSFARFIAFQRLGSIRDSKERIAATEAFLASFPKSEWNHNPRGQEFIYYSVYRLIGTDYFEGRQFNKLLDLRSQLNFKEENEIFRWNVMRAYVFKLLRYDSLYQVATPLIKDLVSKVNDSSYIEAGGFTVEAAMENARQQLDNELTTYIQLLNSLEKYAEAYDHLRFLSNKGRYGNAELNEVQLAILEKLGKKEEVQPFLEKTVAANAVTEAMFSKLKSLYQQSHKNGDGYDAYLASLRSADEQKLMQAHVKEHLTNNEYRPFAVESADGELVRSSEWGDKIVVIDFWATWCKPCIQALPGMQMLVDKYSKDNGVAIYCMGTMQTGDYKPKSVNYVKGQGLVRLNLLHDAVNKETGEQDAVFKSFVPFFHSSAIPRKIVLKDGVMRYSSEGYSGSPSKLVDELSYVIEMLKAEK
jgi:thiol-disulfide isomerase/thioredoxin